MSKNFICQDKHCPRKDANYMQKKAGQYFYLENDPTNIHKVNTDSLYTTLYNRTRERPLSSGCVKSCTKKCSKRNTSKENASESKISRQMSNISTISNLSNRNFANNNEGKQKMDPESVNQLKTDMDVIKQQLHAINAKRNEVLDATNQLQARYLELNETNSQQAEEIKRLKAENQKLNETIYQHTPEVSTLKARYSELSNQSIQQHNEINRLKLQNRSLEQTIKEQTMDQKNKSSLLDTQKSMDECEERLSKIYTELLQASKDELSRTKSVLDEKEKEVGCFQRKSKAEKDKAMQLEQENQDLRERIASLELELAECGEKLKTYKTQYENRDEEMNKIQQYYMTQIEEKTNRLSELSMTVDNLQKHMCECKEGAKEAEKTKMQYHDLLSSHNTILDKLDKSEETLKSKSMQLETLQASETQMKDEIRTLKTFNDDLRQVGQSKDLAIARMHSVIMQNEKYIDELRAQFISKERRIFLLTKNEERYKKQIAQLLREIACLQVCGGRGKASATPTECYQCEKSGDVNLTQELQQLINSLYEEIDKTMNKDDQIEKQYENICCLECRLTEKENEVAALRSDMAVIRNQFGRAVSDKTMLARKLRTMQRKESTVEETNESTTSTSTTSMCECEYEKRY